VKWPSTFESRLSSWTQLREQATALPLESALEAINAWWFLSPWTGYYLHWDDIEEWPDPWQLLDDNMFCEVARGLGILYTITMLDRPDLQDAVLIEVDSDNLVLVDKKKYILNWDPEQMLNITLGRPKAHHSITQEQIKQQIR
jgi:hypothetical protein